MKNPFDKNGGAAFLLSAPQYEIEDTASYLLYEFDKRFLKCGGPVNAERFVRDFAGMRIAAEYLSNDSDSLCFTPLEPQTAVFFAAGNMRRVSLGKGEIAVEKAILDRFDKPLYFYALFHAFAHFVLHFKEPAAADGQISFGLKETESRRNFLCSVNKIAAAYAGGSDGAAKAELAADNFALCLMLPKNAFKLAANNFMAEEGINRAYLPRGELSFLAKRLAEKFEAPEFAVIHRLEKLNYI